jgi:hypothetical protein
MDIQKLMEITLSAHRDSRSDYHVTLSEVIDLARSAAGVVRFTDGGGPGEEESYRGYYSDLSFNLEGETPAVDFLKQCEAALGTTYGGYKGGDFQMNGDTPLWRAEYGNTGEAIVDAEIVDGDLVLRCKRVD